MDQKLLKQYLNRTGFQRAGLATLSSAPWYRGVSQPGVLKAPRGFTGMQDVLKYEAPAAGTGIALALRQKDRDKPVTTETEEPTPPEQKPPEDKGPDILSELATGEILKESGDKIKKANNDLENKATYKFQYMANKEGDQTIGNREIILKLDKEIFNKYVKKLSNIKTFEKHEKEFPNTYVRFFKRGDLPEYRITKVGQLGEEIVPEVIEDSIYNIKVKDFNSKKAIKHSKTFDSDVYPIEKAMGGIIDKPLTGNSRYI